MCKPHTLAMLVQLYDTATLSQHDVTCACRPGLPELIPESLHVTSSHVELPC